MSCDRYNLAVEGLDLRAVMGTLGVAGTKTRTNHVLELNAVLGIEAARTGTALSSFRFLYPMVKTTFFNNGGDSPSHAFARRKLKCGYVCTSASEHIVMVVQA